MWKIDMLANQNSARAGERLSIDAHVGAMIGSFTRLKWWG